jgi:hypothetical protein
LTFYRFESWKKLKAKQIIKLLESFWYNRSHLRFKEGN